MKNKQLAKWNEELKIQKALGIKPPCYHVWVQYTHKYASQVDVIKAVCKEHAEFLARNKAKPCLEDGVSISDVQVHLFPRKDALSTAAGPLCPPIGSKVVSYRYKAEQRNWK